MDEARDLPLAREGDLGWGELVAFLAASADGILAGRLKGELVVAPAVYNAIPGAGHVFKNAGGGTVWHKTIFVPGAPLARVGLTVVLPPDGGLLLG